MQALRALSVLYLLLPLAFFAYGWLRPAYALMVVVVVAAAMAAAGWEAWQALRSGGGLTRAGWRAALPAVLLLLAWLLLSGIGGLGYQNDDYRAGNALFKQLILGDWPLSFAFEGRAVPVVYYLGYYLPAAAVGKALGWAAANAALWGWSALGLGLSLAWFAALSRVPLAGRPGRTLALTALFALAGGLDFVAVTVLRRAPPGPAEHLEFWASAFQFSSQTTLLYWVPQHALAAWLLAALVLDGLYHPHDLRWLALSIAAGMLWSPLGVLGLLPFLLLLAGLSCAPARRRLALRPAALAAHAAALVLAVIVGLYLTANRATFPIGGIWRGVEDPARLARLILGFWWVEVGALAVALALNLWLRLRPQISVSAWLAALEAGFGLSPVRLAVLAASLATLTLLPLFRFGFNNDLAMRGSIPALFALWTLTAQVLLGARERSLARPWSWGTRLAYLCLVVVLGVGSLPALAEMTRSIQNYQAGPPPLESVVPMADADRPHLVSQRAGDPEAFFFQVLSR